MRIRQTFLARHGRPCADRGPGPQLRRVRCFVFFFLLFFFFFFLVFLVFFLVFFFFWGWGERKTQKKQTTQKPTTTTKKSQQPTKKKTAQTKKKGVVRFFFVFGFGFSPPPPFLASRSATPACDPARSFAEKVFSDARSGCRAPIRRSCDPAHRAASSSATPGSPLHRGSDGDSSSPMSLSGSWYPE